MQFLAFGLLAASAVVSAIPESSNRGGGSKSHSWIRYFDNLVAFGDSYTDESRLGYFINHNGTAPPPGLLLPPSTSTPGGGITWDRWVSNYTGAKLYNYAVSGAVCDNNMIYRYLASIFGPFPDVVYEVDAFIADTKFINATTKKNTLYPNRYEDNTVYSMWIGTNDLGNGAFLTDSSLHGTTIPDYVDCIFKRFDEIYKNGGRYFVLMNTAPLELSPLYGLPGKGGLAASHYWPDKPANITEVSYKMKEYTNLVNSIFDYRAPFEIKIAKRYPGASIAVFDVHSLMTDIYNNPTKYLSSPANVEGQYYLCDVATGSKCTTSSLSLDHYMWFDELHPSERTDQVIAKEFEKVVKGKSTYATYW
ncbi:carbohydrate esterase family 16 protein [Cadophora sp. MPI-SDFR-AT-0126]|nr:carbohydrate esterase family 16 protein [Leotiomycetes sp. MPI-SDFR-AT-0126]